MMANPLSRSMALVAILIFPMAQSFVAKARAADPHQHAHKKIHSPDHTMAHPGDPIRQEEHSALFELVADKDATHIAIADGVWSNAEIWSTKSVPTIGSRVVIPKDKSVTIAARHDSDRLDWVRVDGLLRFDPTRDGALNHGLLEGMTTGAMWKKYRLAIGGRMAPAKLTACPDIQGGSYGPAVPVDPAIESQPNTAVFGSQKYEQLIGKATADKTPLFARYIYDPILVKTPQQGYVATIRCNGKEYQVGSNRFRGGNQPRANHHRLVDPAHRRGISEQGSPVGKTDDCVGVPNPSAPIVISGQFIVTHECRNSMSVSTNVLE